MPKQQLKRVTHFYACPGTPAMEAGLMNHVWSYEEVAALLDRAVEKAA
jgi:hypothetical protein